MKKSASCSQPSLEEERERVERCRTYWRTPSCPDFDAYRAASHYLEGFCQVGRRPPLQCMFARLGCCKGRMLGQLARTFQEPLEETEEQLLWYVTFALPMSRLELDATKRFVRADFIRWLLTSPMTVRLLTNNGVRIDSITLRDDLDLGCVTLHFPVLITNSYFLNINLTEAHTRSIGFAGCECKQINAAGITIDGSLSLSMSESGKSFYALGPVDLTGARISGTLDCSGGHFTDSHHPYYVPALKIDLANIRGNVCLTDTSTHKQFEATGLILAKDMTVRGDFDCTNAIITNQTRDRHAISLDRSKIRGSVFLRNGFNATGQVRLIGTRVANDLDCSGGTFLNNEDGGYINEEDKLQKRVALEARNSHIHGCVYLGGSLLGSGGDGKPSSFKTDGLISFDFAQIACDVFIGKHHDNNDIISDGDDENLNAKPPVTRTRLLHPERINIRNAEIGGSLSSIANFSGVILDLENTAVDGFYVPSAGRLWPKYSRKRFLYNHIHFLDIDDHKKLISCSPWVTVSNEKTTFFRDYAYVRWLDQEEPRDATFDPHTHEQLATVLSRSGEDIAAKTILIDKEDRRRGLVPLTGRPSRQCEVKNGSKPQPISNDRDAVGPRYGSAVWNTLLKVTMQYGYKPWTLLRWSVLIVAVGWALFFLGNRSGLIVPVEKIDMNTANHDVLTEVSNGTSGSFFRVRHCVYDARQWTEALKRDGKNKLLSIYYPAFDPLIYSLEVFLPVVKFGQQAYWQPDDMGCIDPGLDSSRANGDGNVPAASRRNALGSILGDILRWWSWVEAALGWICVSLVAVALTGLVSKSSGKA